MQNREIKMAIHPVPKACDGGSINQARQMKGCKWRTHQEGHQNDSPCTAASVVAVRARYMVSCSLDSAQLVAWYIIHCSWQLERRAQNDREEEAYEH